MDTATAILEAAARFANEELAPTNRTSDEQGAQLVNGEVVMPDGFAQAYRKWVDGGWGSVSVPREYGGQGLPFSLSMALTRCGTARTWPTASIRFSRKLACTPSSRTARRSFSANICRSS